MRKLDKTRFSEIRQLVIDEVPRFHINKTDMFVNEIDRVVDAVGNIADFLVIVKNIEAFEVLVNHFYRRQLESSCQIAFDINYVRGVRILKRACRLMSRADCPDKEFVRIINKLLSKKSIANNLHIRKKIISVQKLLLDCGGTSIKRAIVDGSNEGKSAINLVESLSNVRFRYKPLEFWSQKDRQRSIEHLLSNSDQHTTIQYFVDRMSDLDGREFSLVELKLKYGFCPSELAIWEYRNFGIFYADIQMEFQERKGVICNGHRTKYRFRFDKELVDLFRKSLAERNIPVISRESSFVYAVADGAGNVKIGVTTDIDKRISALQSGNAMELKLMSVLPGDINLEKELHKRFEHLWVRGEWFKLEEDIITYFQNAVKKSS